METLKKLLTFLITLMFVNASTAQNMSEIQQAFSDSYTKEYNGEYRDAIKTMNKVYMADSYEINLRLGWLNYMAGLFTESVTYYQKAMALKPLSIEAKFGFVNPAASLGNWQQVENTYLKILEIDPQNTKANYRMGSILYGREDYEKALKYFEKVVNLYPFDYDSLIMYAWTSLKLGKLREAEVLFNKALMYNPGDESATTGLGSIK